MPHDLDEIKRLKRYASLRDAYRRIFRTEDGKLIWDDLSKAHYMLSSTFSSDALELARREGERNVLLRIMAIINSEEVEYDTGSDPE